MSCLDQSSKRATSQKWLSFVSPAKINLFFRVLYKRDDGFHEIASLYQAIDLYDTLFFRISEKDAFTCSDPSLAMDEKNLVCKAVKAFREKTGVCDPLEIHLEKRIPMQAGLGGGSSNAATTLWALSQIFSIPMTQKKLVDLGSTLGSDVPFFFSSGTAYCTGRGEKLDEMATPRFLKNSSIWIAKPSIGLSTPLVYGACKPLLITERCPQQSLDSFFSEKTPFFYNDLEEAAFSVCQELSKIKKSLLDCGFDHVVMCGSGTAFFCIGPVLSPVVDGLEFFQTHPVCQENLRWYAL